MIEVGQDETREQMLERVYKMIREARIFVVAAVGRDDRLAISSLGVSTGRIPEILRDFADHIDGEHRESVADKMLEQLPPDRKATCPCCAHQVFVTREIPGRMMAIGHAMCVCMCGAFLVPSRGESGSLLLRLVTDEEIAALPDQIRNDMIRTRRELEDARSKR